MSKLESCILYEYMCMCAQRRLVVITGKTTVLFETEEPDSKSESNCVFLLVHKTK